MRILLLLCFALLAEPATASTNPDSPSGDVAIVGATLIDVAEAGRSTHDRPNSAIVVRNGVIAAVGDRDHVALPRGVRIVDASGAYVVPGLIDGFGALRTQGFADAYLYEGVTTVYVTRSPVGGDGEQVIVDVANGPRVLRGMTLSGYSATGALPTVHPWTEHRQRDPRRSAADLIRQIDEFAGGGGRGLLLGLDVLPEQLAVVVGEARKRHLATTAVPAFTSYPEALRGGVGALLRHDRYQTALAPAQAIRAYADDPTGQGAVAAIRAVCTLDLESPALEEFGRQLAGARTALLPILAIEATADDVGAPNPWLSRSAAFVRPGDLDDPVDPKTGARPYLESHPDRRLALQACAERRQEIDARLHRLGVTYLAGSGAPAYGIMPGGGLHQELRLLQRIGLTPREVLAAATSNFADVFGWTDIGRVEAGRAADLLIVNRDPRVDVAALEDIRYVVHDGRRVDRKALLARAPAPAGDAAAAVTPPDPSIRAARAALGTPELFAPEAGWPAGSDASPAFTPDGRTVFFTHAVGASRAIMVSHLRDGAWSKPETASFSGTWRDIEPAMAPDGTYLVFVSNRPATPGGKPLDGFFGGAPRPGAGGNLWRVDRRGETWGEPIRLPEIVNGESAIYSPAVARDGSVYFNQPDPITRKSHIYRAQRTARGFLAPVALSISHGEVADFDAAVAPDESFVVFSSVRPPAPEGKPALFVTYAQGGAWSPPQALQPVTVGLEARFSPDLASLYFSAEVPAQSAGGPRSADAPSRIFRAPFHIDAVGPQAPALGPAASAAAPSHTNGRR